MASQDDINSTLKNIVSNVGLLANATAVAASINSVQTAIVNLQAFLSTALATTHLFGGTVTIVGQVFSTVVTDIHVVSNSVITFAPANTQAGATVINCGPYISTTLVPGASFKLQFTLNSTVGGEIFNYVGYNP